MGRVTCSKEEKKVYFNTNPMPSTGDKDIWKYVRERKMSREGRTTMPFSLLDLVSHAKETFKTQARSGSCRINQKATQQYLLNQASRRSTRNYLSDLCSSNDDTIRLTKLADKVIKNLRNNTTPAQDNVQARMLKHSPDEFKSAMALMVSIVKKARYFPKAASETMVTYIPKKEKKY
jgi:hypothetical protein